jgi:glycerophosphoryl diester phosphodiesterase
MHPSSGRYVRRPLVISHRTNMGTMPENSLAGIQAALRDGVDGVEIDVRATADGVPVLLHDATIERTAGDPREVSDVTLAELREVRLHEAPAGRASERVPTLTEALAAVGGRAILVVEVKQAGIEEAVAREIQAADAERWCWIWAFDPAVADACRAVLPGVPVALNSGRDSGERYGYGSAVQAALERGLRAVSLDHRLVDRERVEEAHRAGLHVYTWSVNEPGDVTRVLKAGVDAICGDDPRLIARVIEAGEGS